MTIHYHQLEAMLLLLQHPCDCIGMPTAHQIVLVLLIRGASFTPQHLFLYRVVHGFKLNGLSLGQLLLPVL